MTHGIPLVDIIQGSSAQTPDTAANSIALNQWTHVVITYQAATGTYRLYLNGSLNASGTGWGPRQVMRAADYIGHSPSGGQSSALSTKLGIFPNARRIRSHGVLSKPAP